MEERAQSLKVKASLAQAVKKLTHSELTNSERPVLVPYNLQLTSMKLLWIYVNRAHRINALFPTNYGEAILNPFLYSRVHGVTVGRAPPALPSATWGLPNEYVPRTILDETF